MASNNIDMSNIVCVVNPGEMKIDDASTTTSDYQLSTSTRIGVQYSLSIDGGAT